MTLQILWFKNFKTNKLASNYKGYVKIKWWKCNTIAYKD